MAIGKALNGKSYAGNPRVRFDEGGSRTGGNAEAWGSTLRKESVFRRMLARKCFGAELLFLVLALTCPSAFSVTNVRWCGTEGDYTNPDMWDGGVVPSTGTDCADLSRTSAGEAVGYIRDGMNITNGWINCGRTNDFTLVMSGGYVHLLQTEKEEDAALKLSRGEVVDATTTLRPTGTLLMSGGKIVVTNGCVSVGERGNGTLTMTGGELWARGRLSIARLEGATGTMTVSGGAKVTAFSFKLLRPSATLVIDGGTLARTRFDGSYTPNGNWFIWGDTGATVQIGANGATFEMTSDAVTTIPISGVPGTAGTLVKRGAGILRFASTAVNTYAGATVVEEGGLMAETPANLPGYDEPGRVTVKSGASLFFGRGWSEAEKATAMENVTVEAGATLRAAFEVEDDDVTISDDLSYPGGMDKYGSKMLTLTGHNVFGGEQRILDGVLRADFGQGLDSGQCVTLCGGWLSSVSGRLVSTVGTGAGQVKTTSSSTPGFTARGVPFSINLLGGKTSASTDDRIKAISAFPSHSLNLNDAQADQPITFENNLNILETTADKPFSITVASGVATFTGSIMDSAYDGATARQTTFKKYGAGTLRLAGAGFRDRCFRFNVEEGDVVLDHPASVTSSANGSGLFFFVNKYGTGTLCATNQTIQTDDNFNTHAGTTYVKGGKLTVKGNLHGIGGTTVLDGAAVSVVKNILPGSQANSTTGAFILTNGVRVTSSGELCVGSNNNNTYGLIEVYDDCCVTSKIVGVGSGDLVQHGGTVYASQSDAPVRIGRWTGHKGFYYMAGGEFASATTMNFGRSSSTHGEMWQTGGTVNPKTGILIGDVAGSTGTVHVNGGELRLDSGVAHVGKDGAGELVVRDGGVAKTGTALNIGNGNASGSGRAMLCKGGTLEAARVVGPGTEAEGRCAEFTFDGGTLRATADSDSYVSGLTAFAVGTGGGTVDTDGHDVVFAQPLTATTLNSDLAHRWSFNGDFIDSVTGESPVNTNGWSFVDEGSGKAVKLTGGSRGTSHISLGPNRLPVDGSEATIEFWVRVEKHNIWQRAFDIGKDANNFFTLTLRRDKANTDYCGITYNGAKEGISDKLQPYNVPNAGESYGKAWNHMCVVCRRNGDGKWTIRAYRKNLSENFVKRGEYDAPKGWSLANQNQAYTYIGRSLQNNLDTSASFDEFRIWKRALTDAEIEENGELGPDALPAATFEKRGAGTLTLTGANTYSQPTVVSGGTLALATGASFPAATAITVASGATLDLGGNAATAASLAGAGTLANGTLTLSGAADISSMDFKLANGVLHVSSSPVTVLEAAGGLTGRFASASLPRGVRLSYSGNQVRAVKGGFMVIVR